MKIAIMSFKTLLLIFLGLIFFTSCHKDIDTSPGNGSGVIYPPMGPSGILVNNKEFFNNQNWDDSGNGYKTYLKTWRLTQEAIAKGFKVYVALIGGDDDPWVLLPGDIYSYWFSGLIPMSYTTNIDSLVIRATTIRDLTFFQSDFYIEYNQ